jgi:translation elongation factor P/translation initiation factor 5A
MEYIIVKTYKPSDIKHDEYILFNNEVYKIHFIRHQVCRNKSISITYKCHDFLESRVEFFKFLLDDKCYEYTKFKKEIEKIFFTVKNGTFIDYNDNIISFLDEKCNIVNIKKENYKLNEEQIIKYIKYGEKYKIIF